MILITMSLMTSPFDFRAERFTQKYAAGQQIGYIPSSAQNSGSRILVDDVYYDTADDVLRGYRKCVFTEAEAKQFIVRFEPEKDNYSDGEWDNHLNNPLLGLFNSNQRNQPATAGAWGAWSECAPNVDGDGKQNRTREIVKHKLVNCEEDKIGHGLSLIEFKDCELPDEEPIYGCMDSEANNYDSEATEDDGSCDSGTGDVAESGCTDSEATNYNSAATVDDGSCSYGDENDDSTISIIDKMKENWVLVGLGIVGLALLG